MEGAYFLACWTSSLFLSSSESCLCIATIAGLKYFRGRRSELLREGVLELVKEGGGRETGSGGGRGS